MVRRKFRTPLFLRPFVYGLLTILVYPLTIGIPLLPRKAVLAFARFLGTLSYWLAFSERKVALANLDLAFGGTKSRAEKRAIARASFQTFYRVILDFAWFSRHSRERIERWVRFDPSFAPFFDSPAAIGVTAHFGNWELMGQAAVMKGVSLVSVAAMFPSERLNRLVTRKREQLGMEIIPRAGALKRLLRILKGGGRVALLMDQNTRLYEGGVFIDFFERPATMSAAAAVLAGRTGAVVVPALGLALPDGSCLIYSTGVLTPGADGAGESLNQRIADAFESEIRKHPGQWLWMYRRWKYIPAGRQAADFPFYARPAMEKKETGS
jgi:Kdo2-lipid IVA lauroyltransferase/acyltransferase